MQTHDFLGRVQERAALPSYDAALRATHAALEVLAERLGPDESRQLAAQLPRAVATSLLHPRQDGPVRFDSDEYVTRVSEREGVDAPTGIFHVRAVLSVVGEAVSRGEIEDVLARLPDDFQRLFADRRGDTPDA